MQIIDKGIVHDKSSALIAGNCLGANGDLLVAFNTGGDLSAGRRRGNCCWKRGRRSFENGKGENR